MYTCPVCGFTKLKYPADDYSICPCCATEFGYTDANRSHAELRQQWLDGGMRWHSRRTPQPYDFNPAKQLSDLLEVEDKSETKASVSVATPQRRHIHYEPSPYGDVRIAKNWLEIPFQTSGINQTATM